MSTRAWNVFVWAVLSAAAALPAFLHYLPATDLPQHVAITSVLVHFDDPAFDFARYFELDLHRTLYLLPYALCAAFGKVLGLRAGMNVVVALAQASWVLGAVLVLRARQQPAWLALLLLPFLYHRAFYWGFVNFSLGVGLAWVALGLLLTTPRRPALEWLAGGVLLLSLLTHIYGAALLVVCLVAWAVFDWRDVAQRWRAWAPLVPGAVVWSLLLSAAPGRAPSRQPPLGYRLEHLVEDLQGGFADGSEAALLVIGLAVALWFVLPRGAQRSPFERALAVVIGLNAVLHFALPQGTESAGYVYFRHGVLALALLPTLARLDAVPERWRRLAPALVGALTLLVVGGHLVAFDAEARSFDAALDAVPQRARVIALVLERDGAVARSMPYLHFNAYAQAERGGYYAPNFPQLFWNVPVKVKAGAVPDVPPGFEFSPERFDDAAFNGFFEYALVRSPDEEALDPSARFPFERVWARPPWHLYRHR